jgi:hypothetical protein
MKHNGNVRMNFPALEPWEMEDSCALDVAEETGDGCTLERIGQAIGVTREMVRQMEERLLRKLAARANGSKELNAPDVQRAALGRPELPKAWHE